jgi:hypothetical protein
VTTNAANPSITYARFRMDCRPSGNWSFLLVWRTPQVHEYTIGTPNPHTPRPPIPHVDMDAPAESVSFFIIMFRCFPGWQVPRCRVILRRVRPDPDQGPLVIRTLCFDHVGM